MFLRSLAVLASIVASTFAVPLTFDNTYDNPSGSLSNVACSDGANGMLTKGFTTFGSLPSFPYIGGAQAVHNWNSTNCGTCWQLTYNGKSVNALAIDTAGSGFNMAEKTMDFLTNGQAAALGRIEVDATQVAASNCRL